MEWNAETVLDALNEFERKPEISPVLNEYLKRIAKNGEIVFPWSKLKPVLRKKLDVVLDEFYENCPVENTVQVPNFETFNFETLKKTILNAVDNFVSAPFTIQRICELVCNPQEHYNRADKYMRGIEKNVLVVSTVEHRSSSLGDGNGNSNPIVNGIVSDSPRDESNDTINGHSSEDSVSSTNLNTASNHVLLENFANVFPSAACIPSPSNICLNREMDNNFIGGSECVEMIDVKFDSTSTPVEPSTTSREEEMDTREDDPTNVSSDSSEVSSGESESPEHSDSSEQSDKTPESIVIQPEPELTSSDATSIEVKEAEEVHINEAEEVHINETEELPNIEAESTTPEPVNNNDEEPENDPEPAETTVTAVDPEVVKECQQDDTVSQSDVEPQITQPSSPPQQESEVPAQEKIPANIDEQESSLESTPDEVPSTSSEPELASSEQEVQNMELEASTSSSSDEPPV